ncbi:gastrula zinc finger protein XlCGF28.1-like [Silurus meridionalis]|nr:gastrula zinc finger protein XlCGF28.1-like [Silurus meridionalis]
MEDQLQQNNVSGVWKGLKTITGHIPSSQHSTQYTLPLTEAQVRMELRRIKARKAAGPDGISSRLLKTCADQLCDILLYIFDLSLKLGKVPQLLKTSCVVPVPKTSRPKDFGDYRPVALTSHLMKTLERLVLTHLQSLVSPSMDPLQFAYQPGIGVEHAVIFLLNRATLHLEKAESTVRVMFFDFSSASNTIQPVLLRDKMVYMGVDHHLTAWILDYLTDRPQYVRTCDCESDMIVCNTGATQGTVLTLFLFTIYTADFMFSSATCHLQKFSDDSAIVGLIMNDDDREYRGLTQNFVDWCQRSCLQINAGKTKELVVDFRRHKHTSSLPLVNIQGKDIVRVDSYKYLGVHLNNKLDWTDNTEAIYKKGQSRLFLLRSLRSFGVQEELLKTFFDSVVASAIFYGVVCWGSSISTADRKRLDKLIRKASSVLGIPLDTVQEVGERRMVAKLSSLLQNASHHLYETVTSLSSSFSDRLLHAKCLKERYRRSFLPAAIRLYNKSCSQ